MATRPDIRSATVGTVSTVRPAAAASSAARRRCAAEAEGMEMTACATWRRRACSAKAFRGPRMATPPTMRPCFAGSSSSRPATRHSRLRASSFSNWAVASPAPSTSTGVAVMSRMVSRWPSFQER